MLRRFFHSQFFAKLFYELLPATLASAAGAYFINSYLKPAHAPPPPAASTRPNAPAASWAATSANECAREASAVVNAATWDALSEWIWLVVSALTCVVFSSPRLNTAVAVAAIAAICVADSVASVLAPNALT